jgi:sugar phosphate isomerase/epimerase
MQTWPIGVFASIDAGYGVKLEVAKALGVPTIQLHTPRHTPRTFAEADKYKSRLAELGITLTAIFGGFLGESYADIPTVERTVGLVPRETRAMRLAEMKQIADFALQLDCTAIGLHLGFVPHDAESAEYDEMLTVTRDLCDYLESNGQALHLETGQEPADVLVQFIESTERKNLFINFDPANMILYGIGDPIEALEKVGRFVRSIHCKDAKWAANPGKEWGQEVPLGEGDVNIEKYLTTLKKIGYTGPLTIEREISQEPERQRAEIEHAVKLLQNLKTKLGV